jgi:hypothetical protein
VYLSAATATAEASPWIGRLICAGLVLAVLIGYPAACAFWPFTSCRKCEGNGKLRSPSRKNWRPCRRCKATGTRVRLGRRVMNWLGEQKENA